MTKTRSAERTEFLSGVLSTALEGGIGYWSVASQIKREGDYPHGDWEYRAATLTECGDDDDWCSQKDEKCQGHLVDLDGVARGIAALLSSKREYRYRHHKLLAEANRENDAGEIDSDIADDIVQWAALGNLVYG
jgi:hypothetical protein